jgi:hypothetical protein
MDDKRMGDAERIVESMEKETELSKVEELIKDNKISFEHEGNKYRVRLLNLAEKEELDLLRRKKFGQLIKDKDILLEKDLIIQYRERGMDINEIDIQIKKLDAEDMDQSLKLGESISKNEGETILNSYKDQILDLRTQKQVLRTQRTLLLEFSLENQLLNYVAQVITYLSFDKFENDKWQRMFKNLSDFQNYEDTKLVDKAGQYSMLLQYI